MIGRTFDQSTAARPRPNRANEGAPNVFIVLDDTGFGHLGCYGSSIATPNIDALAADGLRYTGMHTTALCLVAGLHADRAQSPFQQPGLHSPKGPRASPAPTATCRSRTERSPRCCCNTATTCTLGKWHLTPADQISAAGPYDRWPLGRGFERYYGFLGGDTHQYYPDLVYDNHQVEPEATPRRAIT